MTVGCPLWMHCGKLHQSRQIEAIGNASAKRYKGHERQALTDYDDRSG